MNQEETRENIVRNEGAAGAAEGNLETEKAAAGSSGQAEAGEIDNLPVESIGSYARVEELLTNEDADETTEK